MHQKCVPICPRLDGRSEGNSRPNRWTRLPLAAVAAVCVLLTLDVARAQSPLVDDRVITIATPQDAIARRAQLLEFIWGSGGFPSTKLPSAVELDDVSPVSGLTNLARIDTMTIGMDAGQTGYAHHFIAQRPNFRLVVLHQGHACTFDDSADLSDTGLGMKRTINALLADGYSVLAVYMPRLVQFATRVTVNDCGQEPDRHDDILTDVSVPTGSPLKFFLEPVAVGLNYLKTQAATDDFPAYEEFAMIGLSGGGWATTVYSAIDPTIKTSIQVAGSLPLYLRWPSTVGDLEQTLPSFYEIAGYPDLYVLGAHGPGRTQVQILLRRDGCCFGEAQHSVADTGMSYDEAVREVEYNVRFALYWLGPGSFRLEIDESAAGHTLSWNAITNQILAELNGDRRYVGAASTSDAFVRALNGTLWHYSSGGGWQNTGIAMVGVPAVLENALHSFDVFFRDPRNQLMHAYPSGSGWTVVNMIGTIITDPVAVSWGPGRFDVVALGRSSLPYHWWWNGNGISSELISASSAALGVGSASLVAPAANDLRVFMRGRFDGSLMQLRSNGAGPWTLENIGGSMRGFPSAVATADGAVRAYVRGHSGQLWETAQFGNGPREWTSVSASAGVANVALRGSPSASVQSDGTVLLHVRAPGDALWGFRRSSGWTVLDHGGIISGSPTSVPGGAQLRDGGNGALWLHDGVTWGARSGLFY
jgi:hypothetical protein